MVNMAAYPARYILFFNKIKKINKISRVNIVWDLFDVSSARAGAEKELKKVYKQMVSVKYRDKKEENR